jgi:hypothetical protein
MARISVSSIGRLAQTTSAVVPAPTTSAVVPAPTIVITVANVATTPKTQQFPDSNLILRQTT